MNSAGTQACLGGTGSNRQRYWTAGQGAQPQLPSTFVWKVQYSNGTVVDLPMDYTKWIPDESLNPIQEQCILMSGYNYDWKDGKCTKQNCFICEIDP